MEVGDEDGRGDGLAVHGPPSAPTSTGLSRSRPEDHPLPSRERGLGPRPRFLVGHRNDRGAGGGGSPHPRYASRMPTVAASQPATDSNIGTSLSRISSGLPPACLA